jgi:hypothetical protein
MMATSRKIRARGLPARCALALLLFVGAALVSAGPVAGQRLQGRVIDTSSEAPVAGAALQLIAPDSTVALYGVTDPAGGFTLTPRQAGEYTLKITCPGYQAAALGPLPLESGKTLEVTVALGVARTPIDTATTRKRGAR